MARGFEVRQNATSMITLYAHQYRKLTMQLPTVHNWLMQTKYTERQFRTIKMSVENEIRKDIEYTMEGEFPIANTFEIEFCIRRDGMNIFWSPVEPITILPFPIA